MIRHWGIYPNRLTISTKRQYGNWRSRLRHFPSIEWNYKDIQRVKNLAPSLYDAKHDLSQEQGNDIFHGITKDLCLRKNTSGFPLYDISHVYSDARLPFQRPTRG
jgi:hypothetical protein